MSALAELRTWSEIQAQADDAEQAHQLTLAAHLRRVAWERAKLTHPRHDDLLAGLARELHATRNRLEASLPR